MRTARGIERVAPRLLGLLLFGGLLAVLALAPAGHWLTDEYLVAWYQARDGWGATLHRVLDWSPRPVAELLNAAYLSVVARTHRPLIAATLWASWGGAIGLAAWSARRAGEPRPLPFAVLLFLLTFLLGSPDEMFFWPFAVFSYLGAWAGLAAVTAQRRAAIPSDRVLLFGGVLASLSVEIGAATVLVDLGLAVLLLLLRFRARTAGPPRFRWPFALLAASAAAVCAGVYLGRMRGMSEVFAPGTGLAGNWVADVRASWPLLRGELFGIPGLAAAPGSGGVAAWVPVAVKLLVLLGLPGGSPACDPWQRGRALAWATALLFGAWLSDVLAMHQFGMPCCSRQGALHQGMILFAFAALPALAFARLRRWMLLFGLAGLLSLRLPALRADLAAMPQAARARSLTWASARGPGEAMVFHLPPPGRLFGSLGSWLPGSEAHWIPPGPPRYGPDAVAAFFRRRTVRFVAD